MNLNERTHRKIISDKAESLYEEYKSNRNLMDQAKQDAKAPHEVIADLYARSDFVDPHQNVRDSLGVEPRSDDYHGKRYAAATRSLGILAAEVAAREGIEQAGIEEAKEFVADPDNARVLHDQARAEALFHHGVEIVTEQNMHDQPTKK